MKNSKNKFKNNSALWLVIFLSIDESTMVSPNQSPQLHDFRLFVECQTLVPVVTPYGYWFSDSFWAFTLDHGLKMDRTHPAIEGFLLSKRDHERRQTVAIFRVLQDQRCHNSVTATSRLCRQCNQPWLQSCLWGRDPFLSRLLFIRAVYTQQSLLHTLVHVLIHEFSTSTL